MTQAGFLAEEEMETVRSRGYSGITVGALESQETIPNTSGTIFSTFQRSVTVSLIDGTYAPSATDVGLKKVVIIVYWTTGAINQQYTLTSYVHN